VVTKPVELSQGVLVDIATYDHLIDGREQMERKILNLKAKISALEQVAHWCNSNHANPDASLLKVQQDQLATSQQQLSRLRREYTELQNHCQRQEDGKEDIKKTDITKLRKVIDAKDLEIGGLRATITALEARPDTEKLKAESERARALQHKLDDHIQEATSDAIVAALQKEEMAKLEATNRSLRLGLKAAEERAQAVAASHKKMMDEAQKKMDALEMAAIGTEYQLSQAKDDANAGNAAIERLQQELETANAANAAKREQLSNEVEAMKVHLQERYEEEIRAARTGLAEAAEADFNARVEESVATQLQAARKELAEAAEADINSRVEEQLVSRVEEQLVSRVAEAMAEKAEAEAALEGLDLGAFDDDEFDQIAAGCAVTEKTRKADTTTTSSADMDTTMSTDLATKPTTLAAPTISFGAPVAFLAAAAPVAFASTPSTSVAGPSSAAAAAAIPG
jgi:DNA repair exonuclease SbcCD ATPase subunit